MGCSNGRVGVHFKQNPIKLKEQTLFAIVSKYVVCLRMLASILQDDKSSCQDGQLAV